MSKNTQPLTLAVLGCGSRARTYCKIAASLGSRYSVVAGADEQAQEDGGAVSRFGASDKEPVLATEADLPH